LSRQFMKNCKQVTFSRLLNQERKYSPLQKFVNYFHLFGVV